MHTTFGARDDQRHTRPLIRAVIRVRDEASPRPRDLMTLHTSELRLEPLVEEHAGLLFDGLRCGALYEFVGERAPESVDALAERFRRLAIRVSPDGRESWLNWALWSVATCEYVGVVQATVHSDQSAHIAYMLFHQAWGKGYARQATAALMDHLHSEWSVREVWATVDVRNRRSIALLDALGFVRVAVRRDAEVIRGVLSDEFVYLLSLDSPAFTFLP
jgi:RimJ/RimL family protein N-acetyltransferase